MIQHVWLIWSLIILSVWGLVFYFKKDFRKEMLKMSLITFPFGLTEPLFVPEYWFPPSIFNLAVKTGFDLESFIFSFAIGGLGTVLYNLIYKQKHVKLPKKERAHQRHKWHIYILFSPVFVFIGLSLYTNLNHIYCGIIAMFIGAIATFYCRPDLKRKVWVGGLLFMLLYFIYFGSILIIYPNYVQLYWNLDALLNIFILGIPIEELLFAFTFGMYWSGLYEHLYWKKLIKTNGL